MIKKTILSLLALMLTTAPALAGYPKSWEWNFQPPASVQANQLHDFHNMLLVIITAIVLFVLVLLIWVVLRYNEKRNPVPSKTTHNSLIEVVWTIVPVMILIVIAIPSFRILFYQGRVPEAEMTIKATGFQWYWGYEYPDHGGIAFSSYMVPENEIDEAAGQRRLLETDTSVVVPVDTTIRMQVTAADVIHAWAVPALGVKKDAVPGRLNETWFKVEKPGVYYGQCSEICGTGHSYMPIKIEAVSREDFDAWVAQTQQEQGIEPPVAEAGEAREISEEIIEEAVPATDAAPDSTEQEEVEAQ